MMYTNTNHLQFKMLVKGFTSFFTFDFKPGVPMREMLCNGKIEKRMGRIDMLANQISQLTSNMGYDIPPEQILSRSIGVILTQTQNYYLTEYP